MIINDLDDYYIVFDTKNRNTELDTLIKIAIVFTICIIHIVVLCIIQIVIIIIEWATICGITEEEIKEYFLRFFVLLHYRFCAIYPALTPPECSPHTHKGADRTDGE